MNTGWALGLNYGPDKLPKGGRAFYIFGFFLLSFSACPSLSRLSRFVNVSEVELITLKKNPFSCRIYWYYSAMNQSFQLSRQDSTFHIQTLKIRLLGKGKKSWGGVWERTTLNCGFLYICSFYCLCWLFVCFTQLKELFRIPLWPQKFPRVLYFCHVLPFIGIILCLICTVESPISYKFSALLIKMQ